MEISSKLSGNELLKAGKLLVKADNLGMDVSGYGELSVNSSSGNVYLWLEDYNFCLYVSPSCMDIYACYSCPIDGEEDIRLAGSNLDRLEKWASKLSDKSDKKEG